jgi:hypothetical protein
MAVMNFSGGMLPFHNSLAIDKQLIGCFLILIDLSLKVFNSFNTHETELFEALIYKNRRLLLLFILHHHVVQFDATSGHCIDILVGR